VIEKGEKVGTLYLCTGNTESSISLASTGVDTTLWHHRLGHMSEKVLAFGSHSWIASRSRARSPSELMSRFVLEGDQMEEDSR
jgi:hypothetical protein